MKKRLKIGLFFTLLTIGLLLPNSSIAPIQADLVSDLFEDFEGNVFPSWSATGLWHIEDNNTSAYPIQGIPSDSHYAWYGSNITGNYATNDGLGNATVNSGTLTSSPVDLTGFSADERILLEFWSYADTEYGTNYDMKQAYITSDGGSTWKNIGNVTIESESSWQHYKFDISQYRNFSAIQIQFRFDTVDNLSNDYLGWLIDDIAIVSAPLEYFDLWIIQDYYAQVGEKRYMSFHVESYFNKSMNVSITVEILGPVSVILYNSSETIIGAYSGWNITLDYTFPIEGNYDVRFAVMDDAGGLWEEWCWWEVYPLPPEYFELWIDQEWHAYLDETKWMNFYIYSYFNHSMSNVTVGIRISGPNTYEYLYLSDTVYMPAWGMWNYTTEFTFLYEGKYDVYFFLIDDMDFTWETWCYWEVEKFYEHFELWIEQENFATVGDYKWMDFYVESYFNHDMWVEIKIEIIDPSGYADILYHNTSVYISTNSSWIHYSEYLFSVVGHYDIRLSLVDDKGEVWDAWCWYEVFESSGEFLWLEIFQEQYALVGETKWMDFIVYSNFSYDISGVTIQAQINTPSGTEDLFLFDDITLFMYSWWSMGLEYTFNQYGYYEVIFKVMLATGETWTHTCSWEVQELNYLELFIDSIKEVQLGLTHNFYVGVINHYNFPQSFSVEVHMTDPEGTSETIFNGDVSDLASGQKWKTELRYTFKIAGNYTIKMKVTTNTDSFFIDSFFDVYTELSTNTTDSTEPPRTTEPTIDLTPGFEFFMLPLIFIPMILHKKRKR
ncbi:hypothetical protein [Candidatus Hodarchaeum mangrovi]